MKPVRMSRTSRVCVVGAGAAGLCALKNVLEQVLDAVAYEKCHAIGGTWVYTDDVDDRCEEDVHSSMYAGLRWVGGMVHALKLKTNVPKEMMGYPDYDYPASLEESFVGSQDVLQYLQSYADHFNLLPHIRLEHEIIRIRPWNNVWEVIVRDIPSNSYEKQHFDLVLICNGCFSTPHYPVIADVEKFKGRRIHSHTYRKPEPFKDETVLVIGAGRSGLDIAEHLHKYAATIYLSHHAHPSPITDFMPNVRHKPDLQRFTATGGIFKDGSSGDFSCVIFCTGYNYTVPFLSVDCGLQVHDNFVYPLYKHCININRPTMALIGLPFYTCPTHMFDLQTRFALKFFRRQKALPSRDAMLADTELELQERWASGLKKRQSHMMDKRQAAYYEDLAGTAEIANIKPVMVKIRENCMAKFFDELETCRENCYRILDDENFVEYSFKRSLDTSS